MSVAAKLQSFLDERQVPYHVLAHHRTYTALEIAAALHVPGKELAKVGIVRVGQDYAMAVLPASLQVDLEALGALVGGQKVELASEQEMGRLFPDCEVGAEPPFGNLYGLPVLSDETLAQDNEIVFEAGTHQDAVKMAYTDYVSLAQPHVARFARAA